MTAFFTCLDQIHGIRHLRHLRNWTIHCTGFWAMKAEPETRQRYARKDLVQQGPEHKGPAQQQPKHCQLQCLSTEASIIWTRKIQNLSQPNQLGKLRLEKAPRPQTAAVWHRQRPNRQEGARKRFHRHQAGRRCGLQSSQADTKQRGRLDLARSRSRHRNEQPMLASVLCVTGVRSIVPGRNGSILFLHTTDLAVSDGSVGSNKREHKAKDSGFEKYARA
jgi:hypothetical protein